VLELEPLDERQAEQLLTTLHPHLPDQARRRVLRLPVQMPTVAAAGPAHPADPRATGVTELLDELPVARRSGSGHRTVIQLWKTSRHTS
jgi:hypothetical protein